MWDKTLSLFILCLFFCSGLRTLAFATKTSSAAESKILLAEGEAEKELELEILEEEETHKLSAEEIVLDKNIYSSSVETLVSELSSVEQRQKILDLAFGASGRSQLDAAQLLSLGRACEQQGLKELALKAYRQAINLDGTNLSAYQALANSSQDPQEKIKNHLKSLSREALISVGDAWFDNKSTVAAMIPYQFAILKEPNNPYLRYKFARKLEEAGFSYYALSAKRYLEAAAIAKQKFLAGDKSVEVLLRDSVEALIRTLAIQGDFDAATKYCHSYISLGYERFIEGDSVRGILRKIQAKHNPFKDAFSERLLAKKEGRA